MYEGNVSNEEKAVIRKIDINATIWRNYITGLYAAPGEIIKLEISQDDLEKIGSLTFPSYMSILAVCLYIFFPVKFPSKR